MPLPLYSGVQRRLPGHLTVVVTGGQVHDGSVQLVVVVVVVVVVVMMR